MCKKTKTYINQVISSIKKNMRKPFKHWSTIQTRYFNQFLQLNKDNFYKNTSNIRVQKGKFQDMSNYLKSCGINKSGQQCRTHFNRLVKQPQQFSGSISKYLDKQRQIARQIQDIEDGHKVDKSNVNTNIQSGYQFDEDSNVLQSFLFVQKEEVDQKIINGDQYDESHWQDCIDW